MMQKVLFIDLDGTIRRPIRGEFVNSPDNQELIPGIKEKLKEYKNNDYAIVVVTNQGGIAHGFKTLESFETETAYLNMLLWPVVLDMLLFSPFDEKGTIFPYNVKSMMRKPFTGMICEVERRYILYHKCHIDYKNSLVVGDREEDEGLAKNAGIRFIHINDFL